MDSKKANNNGLWKLAESEERGGGSATDCPSPPQPGFRYLQPPAVGGNEWNPKTNVNPVSDNTTTKAVNNLNFPAPAKKKVPAAIDCNQAAEKYNGLFIRGDAGNRAAKPAAIDCNQAAKKYNGLFIRGDAGNRAAKPAAIDCNQAAEKYNGLFIRGDAGNQAAKQPKNIRA